MRSHDAWYDAFGVEPGDAMYLAPEQRVKLLEEAWRCQAPKALTGARADDRR